MSAIQKAVDLMGGRKELATAAGVSEQAVSFWINGDRQISAEYAVKIQNATGGRVTVKELRPDIFGAIAA